MEKTSPRTSIMKEDPCPCETCISFAMCYNREEIKCEDLYRFLCYTNVAGFKAYKCYNESAIRRIYKRFIGSTKFGSYKIYFTDDRWLACTSMHGDVRWREENGRSKLG